jgi:hypothetical protein
MKIHVSSNVTIDTVHNAAKAVGVTVEALTEHYSRTHDRAFNIVLSGSSNRNAYGKDFNGATFDEWGVFFEFLYRIDPTMYVANTYFDYHHFNWTFNARYAQILDGDPTVVECKQHRWNFDGHNMTGAYSVQSCACGAILRRVTVRQGEKALDAWHRLTSDVHA